MEKTREHHFDWKVHLNNLPTIKGFPKWQGGSRFACLVIPIFSFDTSDTHIKSYVAKSAAWALKTWKENSDARLFNVDCFIYVESVISKTAIKILTENGVPKDHIIVADFPNGYKLSKCLQPIFEKAFEKYEYLIITDTDMFAMKNIENERLRFFENLMTYRPKDFGCKIFTQALPTYWMNQMPEADNSISQEKLIESWSNTLKVLTRKNVRKHIDGGVDDVRPWTGTMVIHKDNFKDKPWLSRACKALGDDEAVIYAWSKVKRTNKFWSLEDIQIPVFEDLHAYINKSFDFEFDRAKDEGRKVNDILFKHIRLGEACLVHHYASSDYKFYEMLGIH